MEFLKNINTHVILLVLSVSGCSMFTEQVANAAPTEIDFSKFPLIACQVAFSHGSFFGFLPPKKGDLFSLDFLRLKALKKLEFNRKKLSYIPISRPLRLDRSTLVSPNSYVNIRFVAEDDSGRMLYLDIQRYNARKPVTSAVWIIHEDQIVQSAALLDCKFQPLSQ